MCRQIVEQYRFDECGHKRNMDRPIVGVKDCLRKTCTKSRNHPFGCRSKSCKMNYGPDINPERPEPGYCSEKCTHQADEGCVIA
ncbi:hypothetical protein BDV93DRAFT_550362 [Ceratobasidium sp. AG-I]|nr:hypothetical protein BDV93DRAFT_550362 [Ceratobasidium sp. AG-I]